MAIKSLNIIICTHNRAESLAEALESLSAVDRPKHVKIIVTIVENACNDGTGGVIRQFSKVMPAPVLHLVEKVPGKTRALNLALSQFDSDLAVFVDDDHIFPANFFLSVMSAFSCYPIYSGFCGRIIPKWDGREPPWVHDRSGYAIRPFPIPNFDLGNKIKEINETGFIPGAGNLFLRRSFIEKTGFFNLDLGPSGHNLRGGEDADYIIRGLRAGQRLLYVPDIVQYHMVDLARLKLPYLFKKAYLRNKVVRQLDRRDQVEHCMFGVPPYLFNLLIRNAFLFCINPGLNQKRYYFVRCGAIIGEIHGCLNIK
ncbi:MAG: glycosyltransferase [Desulfobacterales bacterium]|jgi:GT2 family glycosyltransferase|nr:glycosyltransferase [Desulfobacterales bacterium]